ncbi:MAG: hypothetical protein QOF36_1245 [Microbacteriaceae bacterium]|jgi:diguanylate cyclase (GGDEF)-like protein|nr:hypothetical protein [Microbacteriaceae bacterium]
MTRVAVQDTLPLLANRAFFHKQLEGALEGPETGSVDVLLFDVDDFEEVNDIVGDRAGDALLTEAGRRVLECVGPDVTAARLGGDTFAVMLTNAMDAEKVAAAIVRSFNAPFRIQGKELHLGVSLGLASGDKRQLQASDLLRRAGIAMYVAKAAGKNRFLRFRVDMLSAVVARDDLESGLRFAVERKEIVVHYQPIVNVSAGGASQVEALARWRHADDLIPPRDFVSAAETSGLINTIGLEVLRLTCAQLRDWLADERVRSVAVNVSTSQLQEPDFARAALEVLDSGGVDPRQLVVEVTERAFVGSARRVIGHLAQLREHGIRIALDDFGTGYSSLSRLQELPVDIIKVDKSFVDGIKTGEETLPILNSIVDLAHNLGLHVTAEGVETAEQAIHLRRLGCEAMQGFYFGRPTSVDLLAEVEWQATDAYRRLVPTA